MTSSDDAERSVGSVWIGGTGLQARGVLVAHRVKGAEAVFGSICFNFEVVGDGFAFRPVAQDHFIVGVFKLEALQHVKW
ncbi:MAG TPA: hypothetical protein VJ756_09275 [Terriglobales bacterium]|nr:hypothetical protein [Terriglobales bacterium]